MECVKYQYTVLRMYFFMWILIIVPAFCIETTSLEPRYFFMKLTWEGQLDTGYNFRWLKHPKTLFYSSCPQYEIFRKKQGTTKNGEIIIMLFQNFDVAIRQSTKS